MSRLRPSLRLLVTLSAVASLGLTLLATPPSYALTTGHAPTRTAPTTARSASTQPLPAAPTAGVPAAGAMLDRPVVGRAPAGGPGSGPVPTTPTPSRAPDGPAPVTMAFGGDVHFESHVAALLRSPSTSLASLRPYLASADLAMVNLETAITRRGTPAPKEYRFRTSPSALTALAGAGVDVVSMANNHAVDYQAVGLQDTLAARKSSPVRIVGIGSNAREAYSPAIVNVRGRRIAVLAASQLRDWTLQTWEATATRPGIAGARPITPLLAAVKSARERADVVVVYLHWGVERMSCPDASQRDAARKLAAAGADVVIGSHPHVTQGAGRSGSAYVAYSLGNFVWYSRNSEASSSTGVLTLTLDGRKVTSSRWIPLKVSSSGIPKPPSAAESARMQRDWQASRSCTGLRAIPSRTSSSSSQSPSPESP